MEDTIAAVATARGCAGLGVVRVSGEAAIEVVERIFRSNFAKKLSETPGYTARLGCIFHKKTSIDEVVVLIFRAPHSYTGENVVEISCHGGPFIVKKILDLVFEAGARPAEPGEFTRRAFLNGKMDLVKAESVAKLVGAQGKLVAKAAGAASEGVLSTKIEQIKSKLLSIISEIHACVEFPDEDFSVENTSFLGKISDLKNEITLLVRTYNSGILEKNGVKTAIVGKPNVGKSSIMNLLAGRECSIVADFKGTTRDVIEEAVVLGDVVLRISDTAGIRETDDFVESLGVDRARKKLADSELIFVVIDGSEPLFKEDFAIFDQLNAKKTIAIINKSDLPQKADLAPFEEKKIAIVEFSAKTGCGLQQLIAEVEKCLKIKEILQSDAVLISERQFFSAKKAEESLAEAESALISGVGIDAVSVLLEEAVENLMSLTGEKVSDAVVDAVFSQFCVGK